MGGKIGHHDAQSLDEIIATAKEGKEQGLATRRGQSIYKEKSSEYQEDKLKELVTGTLPEVAAFATTERVSLEDTKEVQKRTIIYLRACAESGTFPSSLGLARSMGYSDRALRVWRREHANTKTGQWLEMFNDYCADILAQSSLKNNANTIMAIFLNKALYDFRDSTEIMITPNTEPKEEYSVEDIKRRYISYTEQEGGTK